MPTVVPDAQPGLLARLPAAAQCRLVYLDADMLVLRNLDALFDLPPGFYAGMGLDVGGTRLDVHSLCRNSSCLAWHLLLASNG